MSYFVPRKIIDGRTLDMEAINDNFKAAAKAINGNLAKRYSYSPPSKIPLDGITSATTLARRQFRIRRPASTNAVEINCFELSLYPLALGDIGSVWTLSCSDTTWPPLVITLTGGLNPDASTPVKLSFEDYRVHNIPVQVPSASADLVFTLSCDRAAALGDGSSMTPHIRCDRGHQGDAYGQFRPDLIDSSTQTTALNLDQIFTAMEDAVDRDAAADIDLRCEIFCMRDMNTSETNTVHVLSGLNHTLYAVTAYAVGDGGVATFTVAGDTIDPVTIPLTMTDPTDTEVDTELATGVVETQDDAPDPASDQTYTIATDGGATLDLGYMLVWWR